MKLLFLIHLFTTIFMTGVIWIVQVVHYPLFAQVGEATWRGYHADHNVLISWIVMPAMLIELATAVFLLIARPENVSLPEAAVGLALVLVAWGATFFLSVPNHTALTGGFDRRAYELLVSTNWWRTAAWTMRSGLVLWQVWKLF